MWMPHLLSSGIGFNKRITLVNTIDSVNNEKALEHINGYLMTKPDDNDALQLQARVYQP
jgi:hypothetical protein